MTKATVKKNKTTRVEQMRYTYESHYTGRSTACPQWLLQRAEMLAQISVCVCAWPLRRIRNGSEHTLDCPAHRVWEARVVP